MFDQKAVKEQLTHIFDSVGIIERRFSDIHSSDDFLDSDSGLDMLDGICMQLVAIGESLKGVDKLTDGTFLSRFPGVDWKGLKGIRDIITHQYFNIDAESVYGVCEDDLPVLKATIAKMIEEL